MVFCGKRYNAYSGFTEWKMIIEKKGLLNSNVKLMFASRNGINQARTWFLYFVEQS